MPPEPSSPEIEALGARIEEVHSVAQDARADAREARRLAQSADNRSMETHALVKTLVSDGKEDRKARKEYERQASEERSEMSAKLDGWMSATKVAVARVEQDNVAQNAEIAGTKKEIGEVRMVVSKGTLGLLGAVATLATAVGTHFPQVLETIAKVFGK